MSKEVLAHIEETLKSYGFKKALSSKTQLVYTLGDNYHNKTKRFARFSVERHDNKFAIAAMTSVAVKGNVDVSRMDWAQSVRVGSEKFDTMAMTLMRRLISRCKKKPLSEPVRLNLNINRPGSWSDNNGKF